MTNYIVDILFYIIITINIIKSNYSLKKKNNNNISKYLFSNITKYNNIYKIYIIYYVF